MKHLENYGVQALSTEELKSTDGGWDLFDLGRAFGYYLSRAAISVVEGLTAGLLESPRTRIKTHYEKFRTIKFRRMYNHKWRWFFYKSILWFTRKCN